MLAFPDIKRIRFFSIYKGVVLVMIVYIW